MRLSDKVAVVTGIGSGIGQAVSMLFAAEGARVVGGDINAESGEATAGRIRGDGGTAAFLQTDVTAGGDVQRLMQEADRRHGRLDILFSNVGIVLGNAVVDVSETEWDHVMTINLKSMFLCCKYAIPLMQRSGKGSIILTSSVNGLVAETNLATYCTSKAGIIGLVKSVATDYGEDNIRANALCPTYTRTPLVEGWFQSQPDPAAERDRADRCQVFGRIAEVDEVARAVLFLASDDSSMVTGSAFTVDGGFSAFR